MGEQYDLKTLLYKVPDLAEWLHRFPHYNFQFEEVDPDFDPTYTPYVESLLLVAAVLGLWLGLWLVIYMVYFLCVCIRSRSVGLKKPSGSEKRMRWATVVFTLLTATAVIVAVYGNEKTHIGVAKAAQSLSEFSDDTRNLYVQTYRLSSKISLNSTYGMALEKLRQNVAGEPSQNKVLQLGLYMKASYKEVNSVIPNMVDSIGVSPMKKEGPRSDQRSSLMSETRKYEQHRWIITLAVCLWQIACCMIIWCSIGLKSRCLLLLCLAFFFLNLVLVWGMAGAYTALSVGGGDFCVNPDAAVKAELNRINANGTFTQSQLDVIDYYLECSADKKSVYFDALLQLQNALISSNSTLKALAKEDRLATEDLKDTEAKELVRRAAGELSGLFTAFLKLTALADCTAAHKSYVEAVSNVCHNSLQGLVYLACSYIVAGLFIIVSVFLIHAAYKTTGTRRTYYDVDSQEPFIPRNTELAPPRGDDPLYYRFSHVSTGDGDAPAAPHGGGGAGGGGGYEPAHLLQRTTTTPPPAVSAPPAYNRGEFYSTYGNSETLDSRIGGHLESEPLTGSHVGSSSLINTSRA